MCPHPGLRVPLLLCLLPSALSVRRRIFEDDEDFTDEDEDFTDAGVPKWLRDLASNGTLLESKILGAHFTPKTRIEKKKALVKIGEEVEVRLPAGKDQFRNESCTLLHRFGRADGKGETVAQVWTCRGREFLYVIFQRASGSQKYIESSLVEPKWPELMNDPSVADNVKTDIRIKWYESYKLDKFWGHYGFRDKMEQLMTEYPTHRPFITGASRGATSAEVIGLRYVLAFRNHPSYKAPYVVSTGAYRWTNSVGRDLMRELLPRRFAHLLLSKVSDYRRQRVFDFVSRLPARAVGFVDMIPSFHIDLESGRMEPCIGSHGCPGPDVAMPIERATLYQTFVRLHVSSQYIKAIKTMMLRPTPAEAVEEDVEKNIFKHWKKEECDMCRGIDIQSIQKFTRERGKVGYHVGCTDSVATAELPLCDVDTTRRAVQASGHLGDFYPLLGGRVAKRFRQYSDSTHERAEAAESEYAFYMQLWCLRGLESFEQFDDKPSDADSVLKPFASGFQEGDEPWAPRFYGLCQIRTEGQSAAYMVMENLLDGYRKASQMDIKVGQTTEPLVDYNAIKFRSLAKRVFQDTVSRATSASDDGARLTGYSVWSPEKQMLVKSSTMEPYLHGLKSTLRWALVASVDADFLLGTFIKRVAEMQKWWMQTGNKFIRSYAGSLLLVWEGDTLSGPAKAPVLKFIDYAHFHSLSTHPHWALDDVAHGLNSTLRYLRELREEARKKSEKLALTLTP